MLGGREEVWIIRTYVYLMAVQYRLIMFSSVIY